MTPEERVYNALKYITPLLKKHSLRWLISGGFACYLYGIKGPIGDIDIDVEASKDDIKFKLFVKDIKKFTTYPLQLWVDKNYDNWVMEVIVSKQKLSICPIKNLKLFNKTTSKYELFYKNSIPKPKTIIFRDLKLPTSPENWVIKMKERLAKKKQRDKDYIIGMRKLIN